MSVVSDLKLSEQSTSIAHYDAVVVGAGPYGLSVAAHLLGRGLKVAVFGKTLELWREHMPKGMFLRSHWWATNLSDPQNRYGFERFFKESQYKKCYPVPIEVFIEYALWFQQRAVPGVDETYVSSVERKDGQFLLTLADGRLVQSQVVVMAIGLYYYAHRPAEFSGFPAELVSHSFEHSDYSPFKGKTLVMIGAGQSAIEYAALLHEAGAAAVHVVARRPIVWLAPDRSDERTLLEQLRAPNAGIAPGWKSWGLEHFPYLFYYLPRPRKDRYVRTLYTAAASDWLRDRVIGKVALHEGQKVVRMEQVDGRIGVTISDGTKVEADHVMLGTGYDVDIKKLPMLHPSLLMEIETDDGDPILNAWFESSVPGLYFTGLSSLREFGPMYRFVLGCKATATRVASAVARRMRASK